MTKGNAVQYMQASGYAIWPTQIQRKITKKLQK